jgi:hypothetical protein
MGVHAREIGRSPRSLDAAARNRLLQEEFPGNVRQLQNVVRQLLVQSGEGEVGSEELERVLRRSTLGQVGTGSGVTHSASAPQRSVAGTPAPSRTDRGAVAVRDVGEWVLEQLRQHQFNLSATAKSLAARRAASVDRAAVPVFDRGALDYYLCGEFYQRLVQREFDMEAAIADLAGDPAALPRLRRKTQAFLRPLQEQLQHDHAAEEVLARAFPRLPERYHPVLLDVVRAVREGRWQPVLPA